LHHQARDAGGRASRSRLVGLVSIGVRARVVDPAIFRVARKGQARTFGAGVDHVRAPVMNCVADASYVAGWLLPDEATPAKLRLLAAIEAGRVDLHVPHLWIYEVGHLLSDCHIH